MDQSPLIAIPETALLALIAAAARSDADKVRVAVDEARRRMDSFHAGQEEMYEDAHPETVTTKVAAFDPTPYLEEAERMDNDR